MNAYILMYWKKKLVKRQNLPSSKGRLKGCPGPLPLYAPVTHPISQIAGCATGSGGVLSAGL